MSNAATRDDTSHSASTSGGAKLSNRLVAISTFDAARLREEWRKMYRSEPPRLSRDLMLRVLAHGMQERVLGGPGPTARRNLRELGRKLEKGADLGIAGDVRLKPGARLIREWHGKIHVVIVLDEGFEFEGRRYRSLSRIARAITGTRWSGPRFFGLRRPPRPFTARGRDHHE